MITIHSTQNVRKDGGKEYDLVELRGLSTDTKPTEFNNDIAIDNGSVFVEINTGKLYFYDLESETWKEA